MFSITHPVITRHTEPVVYLFAYRISLECGHPEGSVQICLVNPYFPDIELKVHDVNHHKHGTEDQCPFPHDDQRPSRERTDKDVVWSVRQREVGQWLCCWWAVLWSGWAVCWVVGSVRTAARVWGRACCRKVWARRKRYQCRMVLLAPALCSALQVGSDRLGARELHPTEFYVSWIKQAAYFMETPSWDTMQGKRQTAGDTPRLYGHRIRQNGTSSLTGYNPSI